MSKAVAMVTGASGEMGHLLIPALVDRGYDVVALDLEELPEALERLCRESVETSILDLDVVSGLLERHRPEVVFHLAAILSTKAEKDPDLAHRVNVDGTFELMRFCRRSAAENHRPVRMMFPSSIAVYGLPDVAAKEAAGAVREHEWNFPTAVYGCNKLYGEMLGTYHAKRAIASGEPGLDFRAIRFPGLLSSETVPSGGTSDYGPEMVHAAARGASYRSFVSGRTRLPFMTMPDAVAAFLALSDVDAGALSTRVYNIRAFAPTAEDFRSEILRHFPDADIGYAPDTARQALVDGWPGDVDDTRARKDWGLAPEHGFVEAVRDYLVPALRERYAIPG